MSTHTTPRSIALGALSALVDKTISKQSDGHKTKTKIRRILRELDFIKKGFKLQISDPSFKLRYQYALNFWSDKTGNDVIEITQANDLIKELKEELNSNYCIHSEGEENSKITDDFFFNETPVKGSRHAKKQSSIDSKEKSVWYVTSKCDKAFYVKRANNSEAEEKINTNEILCDYKLISPGDEVQVMRDNMVIQSVHITK
jgi:hypothetical protein